MPKVERIITSPLSTSRPGSVGVGGRGTCASCLVPINNQRGQSLVELGMIVALFVLLSMGMIEFGRAFMVANMITHAARDGARAAAVMGSGSRDGTGMYLDPGAVQTTIDAQVKEEIKSVLDAATVDLWPLVDVEQLTDAASGLPVVQVTVNGTVPYIFNLVGTGFNVARTVTFRDEGR